ncbi:MAG: hypothetical protein LQ351_004587 [Letrouitia transgressa]|nr:MAG: hypothetical protein LQ351_004587 [Letrouitia transgressa]
MVLAQAVVPTNWSAPTSTPSFLLDAPQSAISKMSYNIDPLTDAAGLSGDTDTLKNINIMGNLTLTTPSTVNNLSGTDIAYINCDPSTRPGNLDASWVFRTAAARDPPPVAIVLYSKTSNRCVLDSGNDDSYVYTMKDTKLSSSVEQQLQENMSEGQSKITLEDNDGGGSILGKSPTTAVAMIILYSITGIITTLFLAIIIVGAIRAHRHPERYGPRHVLGRGRQSRAKGIARAMLETLPIVKFGELDEPKPTEQGRDIEMGGRNHDPNPIASENESSSAPQESRKSSSGGVIETEAASESVEQPASSDDPIANADNGLACSVCTDDFSKGQDVRILPCKHKFHPECIDPWLLNVSGTCPLCRVDLRPTASEGQSDSADPESSAEPGPSPNPYLMGSRTRPQDRRSRNAFSLYLQNHLNIGRMRNATPEERIEALRRLRMVDRPDVEQPRLEGDDAAGERSRSRLSVRLSRAFGDRSRPVSGVPSTSATPVPESSGDAAGDQAQRT